MAEGVSLKLIEVAVLLVAGVGFVWWQLRDIKRAQAQSALQRREREAKAEAEAATASQAADAALPAASKEGKP
jgi:uncharacterized ion transporter superfamily protein YfcC